MNPKNLYIVVPCYNEEEIINKSVSSLSEILNYLIEKNKISAKSKIILVDDGSIDKTWHLMSEICENDEKVGRIKLSRNFGHQAALLAGMFAVTEKADVVITIDADLQDDISAIEKMIDENDKGYKIVYGVREKRDTDSFFKRITALAFYRFMTSMNVDIISNHADFRLLDRVIIEELKGFKERKLFLRGIIPLIGYPSSLVYYDRLERTAGTTKYPLKKMLVFAWGGITSFSTTPLRIVFYIGLLIFLSAILLIIWASIAYFNGISVIGWASIVIPIFAFSGIQMISIGLLGEYLSNVYTETKKRPLYIIEKIQINE